MTKPSPEPDETELLLKHGALLWEANIAFTEDAGYLIEMVEHATLIEYKRNLWLARRDAKTKAESPNTAALGLYGLHGVSGSASAADRASGQDANKRVNWLAG